MTVIAVALFINSSTKGDPKLESTRITQHVLRVYFVADLGIRVWRTSKNTEKKPSTIIITQLGPSGSSKNFDLGGRGWHGHALSVEWSRLPSEFYAFFCTRSSQDISTTKGGRMRIACSMPSTSSFQCFHSRKRPAWGLGQEVEVNQIQQLLQNTLND